MDDLWRAWNDAYYTKVSEGLCALPPEIHERVVEILRLCEEQTHKQKTSAEIYDYGRFVLFRSLRVEQSAVGTAAPDRQSFAALMHVSDARRLRDELSRVLQNADGAELAVDI